MKGVKEDEELGDSMMKLARRTKILELVSKYEIRTQEELIARLRVEGYDVTQATISRDIRKLNLIKTADGKGKIFYKPQGSGAGFSNTHLDILRSGFLSMDVAGNILVMKTVPGMAQGVGSSIDALGVDEILGCIAGDDTILVVIKSEDSARKIQHRLKAIIEGNES